MNASNLEFMKSKILSITTLCAAVFAASLLSPSVYADDGSTADKPKIESKAELKARFKKNVETSDFGDAVIRNLPEPDASKVSADAHLGGAFLVFISYADPEFDFDALAKYMKKAIGKKKSDAVPIAAIMAGVDKGLARKNMAFQKMKFAGTTPAQKIADGLPIFCWLRESPAYRGAFKSRTDDRSAAGEADAWAKTLRKLELKKVPADKTMCLPALVLGYNKTTSEYLVAGASEKPVWITEKELKSLVSEAYVLRF